MDITNNLKIEIISDDPNIIKYLQDKEFFYLTDITLLSKERFLNRYADDLADQDD